MGQGKLNEKMLLFLDISEDFKPLQNLRNFSWRGLSNPVTDPLHPVQVCFIKVWPPHLLPVSSQVTGLLRVINYTRPGLYEFQYLDLIKN